jgi:hypothetical protein
MSPEKSEKIFLIPMNKPDLFRGAKFTLRRWVGVEMIAIVR